VEPQGNRNDPGFGKEATSLGGEGGWGKKKDPTNKARGNPSHSYRPRGGSAHEPGRGDRVKGKGLELKKVNPLFGVVHKITGLGRGTTRKNKRGGRGGGGAATGTCWGQQTPSASKKGKIMGSRPDLKRRGRSRKRAGGKNR